MSITQKGPVYLSIYSDLKQMLQDGRKRPGDDLPSENTLAAQYRTTRTTVRKSLQLLEKEGLIYSWAGKGYFVSKPAHNAFSLDFPEDEQLGDSRYRRISVIKSDSQLQQILHLEPGKRVIKICRSIDQGDLCVACDIKYLPYEKGTPLLEQELNYFVPFPDIVAQIVPTFLFYTELEISAVSAPQDIAQVLGCAPGDPLLLLQRRFMNQEHRCIGYGARYQRQCFGHGSLTAHSGYHIQHD